LRFVLVQRVESPAKAEGWGHLLSGVGPAELDAIEGIEVSERPGRNPLAEVERAGGGTIFLSATEEGLQSRVRALWGMRSLYPEGVLVRRVQPDGAVRPSAGEVLIRYRTFSPGELAAIVDSGTVLPAGITRFRIQERVLGVRYPLDGMREGEAAAQNAKLKEFVERSWGEDRIRYYGEPVVLFE
jgi:hypothetical protein